MRKHYWLLIAAGILVFSSCQKSYNPPDLVISGSGGGNGNGGGSTPTAGRLVKSESQTVGTSESSSTTYEYDASGRISKITLVQTDTSNKTYNIWYLYTRDASGKVTKVATNILAATSPGTGFPDTVFNLVHYPSGSSNFDYVKYSYNLLGIDVADSIAYVYSGNTITDTYDYQRMVGIQTTGTRIQYGYSNGNMTSQKIYDSTGTNVLATYTYEYDSKTVALNVGNEAFLPGLQPGYSCKNNQTKGTYTIPGNPTGPIIATYTYQYNSSNQPITGSALIMPLNHAVNLRLTYQ